MFDKYQYWKFANRKRDESPDLSIAKIDQDEFLTFLYQNAYSNLLRDIQIGSQNIKVVEIGSAGGILKTIHPEVVTSDIRKASGVDLEFDAQSYLPFHSNSIDFIIGKDVLHHLHNVELHFQEMLRVLKPGGQIRYLEPNWNHFSRLIFSILHPEPFLKNAIGWKFESSDPMFSNQALPFIIFQRDIDIFKKLYPNFQVEIAPAPINAISFLLSGGVYSRTIIPGKFLIWLTNLEESNKSWMRLFGLNRVITLTKKS